MQGFCKNPECKRLIFDTEKVAEIPDAIECQHCHTRNVIREKGKGPEITILEGEIKALEAQREGYATRIKEISLLIANKSKELKKLQAK